MRISVVLPARLGPTSPTRSPWNSSNEMSSNNGPRSKPRLRLVQLINSMRDSFWHRVSCFRQEALNRLGVGDIGQRPAEERLGIVVAALETKTGAIQEQQRRLLRAAFDSLPELFQVQGMLGGVVGVQLARGEFRGRPI